MNFLLIFLLLFPTAVIVYFFWVVCVLDGCWVLFGSGVSFLVPSIFKKSMGGTDHESSSEIVSLFLM